jgi:thiamine biosynthesis lipoprotein
MSVTITITGVDVQPGEMARAVNLGSRLAADWEARFSRFRLDSQLTHLNAAAGAAVRVDTVFIEILETAKAAVRRTAGRFDPSILPALENAGYDRSIEQVAVARRTIPMNWRPAVGLAGWELVQIDRARGEVRLPPAMQIDLGGIAKGAFVDHFSAALRSWPGGCIDAGGDLRVWGIPPAGDYWSIGIEDPFQPESDRFTAQVHAHDGVGVATSATHRRRWQMGDRIAHHLIDPGTGLPANGAVRAATAFASDTCTADIAAKSLLIAAAEHNCGDLLGAASAVIIYEDGQTVMLPKDSSHECSSSHGEPIHHTA